MKYAYLETNQRTLQDFGNVSWTLKRARSSSPTQQKSSARY